MGMHNAKAEENPFYEEIRTLIFKKNRNVLIVITGGTGTGKSYVAIKMAKDLDPTFTEETMKERIISEPKDFLNIMDNPTLTKGKVLIFDEAGVGIPAREWYSINNRAIDYILQTFRYKNLIVIFTVPLLSYIDTHARKLFRFYMETVDVDFTERTNEVKAFEFSINPKTGKVYMKYPVLKYKGYWRKFTRWKFSIAPAKIVHKYEKIALEIKERIQQKERKKLADVEEKEREREQDKLVDIDAIAREIIANPEPFFSMFRGNQVISGNRISAKYRTSSFTAHKIKYMVEDKLRADGVLA